MELIYSYIKKFRNIESQEINFSNKFSVSFNVKTRELNVVKKSSLNIFPDHVVGITAIAGRNGAGKTNICDMLMSVGMEYDNDNNEQFFNLFYIENDLFYLECSSLDIFPKIIGYEPLVSKGIVIQFTNKGAEYVDDLFLCSNQVNMSQKQKTAKRLYHDLNIVQLTNYDANKNHFYHHVLHRTTILKSEISLRQKLMFIYDCIKNGTAPFDSQSEVEVTIAFNNTFYKRAKAMYEPGLKMPNSIKFIAMLIINMIYQLRPTSYHYHNNVLDESYENKYDKLIEDFAARIAKNFSEENLTRENFVKLVRDLTVENKVVFAESIMGEVTAIMEYVYANAEIFQDELNFSNMLINKNTDIIKLNTILKLYDKTVDIRESLGASKRFDFFNVNFDRITDGQKSVLNLFAGLAGALNKNEVEDYTMASYKNNIVIFDEPEVNMHPEYCRSFINTVIEFVSNIHSYNFTKILNDYIPKHAKFQFILTTHSAFMLSDLPQENIIMINKDSEGKAKISTNNIATFGANIHNILKENFFMKLTIGEFAKNYIDNLITVLSPKDETEINKLLQYPTLKDIAENLGINAASEDGVLEEIERRINVIAEPIIRHKLHSMLDMCICNGRTESDLVLRNERKIKRLQAENKKLKKKGTEKQSEGNND